VSEVPVLLFQVGARVYAAPAAGVRRVAGAREAGEAVEATALGRPFLPARRLVAEGEGGEELAMEVDQVLGLRLVPPGDLQPLPPVAQGVLASRALTGTVLLDGIPTPVVDLPLLLAERRRAEGRGERSHHA